MGKRVISFELNEDSISQAIKEIEEYRDWLTRKMEELREKVAYRIAWSASSGFSNSLVSDVIRGKQEMSDVSVRIDSNDNVTVVIAEGKKAVFIEFGAGVYYNGPVGSSPHPWVSGESPNPVIHGFTIGSYDKGNGAKKAWGYYDDDGKVVVTRGTPAAMPMYRGAKEAIASIKRLAQEVFG